MDKRNPFAGSTVADRTGARAPVARHTHQLRDERRVKQVDPEKWAGEKERRKVEWRYPG